MNILLLIFDDLTPDRLGCYGDPLVQTPNIDRLAARGTLFENAFTPCAICSPGRACLFSGLRPDTHGVTTLGKPLRGDCPDLVTWPQALRSRGYATTAAGKVFHKGVPDGVCVFNPTASAGGDPFAWDRYTNPGGMELNANGAMANYTPWETHGVGIGGAISWLRAEKGDRIHHDARVADDICSAIRCHDGDKPALWAAGFIRPHVPLVAPKRFFEALDDQPVPMTETPNEATPLVDPVANHWCSSFGLTTEQRREAIRAYSACVGFVDEQIGRILAQLEASGHAEDTIVVLTGDHGFQLGEHGLWFKNYLYRESVQIPLIIADPSRPASHGRRCAGLVEQPDLFPTLIDLLDLPPVTRQPFEGTSLLGLMTGTSNQVRTGVIHQVDWGPVTGRCLRTDAYSYVRWSGAYVGEQLFDLRSDPGEHIDLLHGGRDHAALADLRQALNSDWDGLLTSA